MKFKLGQKVRYKRIIVKNKVFTHLDIKDFGIDEKIIIRRKPFELVKERIGYVMGRRKIVFATHWKEMYESNPEEDNFIDISNQDYNFVYVIAYNMGQTNFVLEEDLKEVISAKSD